MADVLDKVNEKVDDAKESLDKVQADLKAKLEDTQAKLTQAQKDAKGFVKQYRYAFIGGAFVLGFLVGLFF